MVVSVTSEFEAATSFNLAEVFCLHCFRVGYNLHALMNGGLLQYIGVL